MTKTTNPNPTAAGILAEPLTLNEARRIAGGSLKGGKNEGRGLYNDALSSTSKMPCKSYDLPAEACGIGSRLRKVAGSTCSGCYALKGSYGWKSTKAALARHLEAIEDPRWADALVVLWQNEARLGRKEGRWHSSGDLQSVEHLAKIVEVCERCPEITFWAPTRERKIIRDFEEAGGEIPPNLILRRSMPMQGMTPPAAGVADGLLYSTTHTDAVPNGAVNCPAVGRKTGCEDCRNCWNRELPTISYRMH